MILLALKRNKREFKSDFKKNMNLFLHKVQVLPVQLIFKKYESYKEKRVSFMNGHGTLQILL